MKKDAIISKIIEALNAELEGYAQSARAAHEYATDEQGKAENKHDTRGLESSYLAHGQARQAVEVVQAMQQFTALVLREFAAGDHSPSLPGARPSSDRPRCGGRESNFLQQSLNAQEAADLL